MPKIESNPRTQRRIGTESQKPSKSPDLASERAKELTDAGKGVDAGLTLDFADVAVVRGREEPGLRRPPVTVCKTRSDETARRREIERSGQGVGDLGRGGARRGEAAACPGSPSSVFGGGGGASREREEASGMGERERG
jgi:hypothetical protein